MVKKEVGVVFCILLNIVYFVCLLGLLLYYPAVVAQDAAVSLARPRLRQRELVGALAPEQLAREALGVPAQIPRALRPARIGSREHGSGRQLSSASDLFR